MLKLSGLTFLSAESLSRQEPFSSFLPANSFLTVIVSFLKEPVLRKGLVRKNG
jgi:hypothetical protein